MAIAKYEEIKQDIVKRILSKEFQPGQKISSEADLKSKYNVSSTTVVKALNELVSEGYVHRIQGKGTFVTKALRGSTVRYFENDYKYYDRSDEHTEVISVQNELTSEILGEFDEGIEVQKITRLKYARNEAIQLAVTYIDSNYIQGASKEQLKSIYDTVREKKNIILFNAKFEENFKILFPVPDDVKKLLKLSDSEPVVLMTQKTFSTDNKLIEFILSYKKYNYFDVTVASV
ncbi:MAG: GntR family transcriptional regulator [Enterococcus avium]